MSRQDLLRTNAEVVQACVGAAAARSPFAILVVVTNPLDEMTYLRLAGERLPRRTGWWAWRATWTPRGWPGSWPSAASVPARTCEAMTLGSHGDTMVPLPGRATVDGRPATELLAADDLDALFRRTRDGGAEIVALLKRGSAFYAPSAATAAMVRAILQDRREVHPACAYLTGRVRPRGRLRGRPGGALAPRGGGRPGADLAPTSSPRCTRRRRPCGRSARSWTRCSRPAEPRPRPSGRRARARTPGSRGTSCAGSPRRPG